MNMFKSTENTYLLKKLIKDYLYIIRLKFAVTLLITLCVVGLNSASNLLLQYMIDDVFVQKQFIDVMLIAFIFFAIIITIGVCNYSTAIINAMMSNQITLKIQQNLLYKIMENHYLTDRNHITYINNDPYLMSDAVSGLLNNTILNILVIIAMVSIMFYQHVTMALLVIGFTPLIGFIIYYISKRAKHYGRLAQQNIGDFLKNLITSFTHLHDINAYQANKFEQDKLYGKQEYWSATTLRLLNLQIRFVPLGEIIIGVIFAAQIIYGGTLVINNELTLGGLFSFLSAMVMTYQPLKTLGGNMIKFSISLASAKRIYDIIDISAQYTQTDHAHQKITYINHINMQDIHFSYDHEQHNKQQIFQDFNADFKQGNITVIKGMSGRGKSSLLALLLGFIAPQSGNIIVNDTEKLSDIDIISYRHHLSYCPQQHVFFNQSLYDNIRYWRDDQQHQDDSEIAALLKMLNLSDDIDMAHLSGGEKQRLAIIRALYRCGDLLIFDEPTSALDHDNAHIFCDYLQQIKQNHIIIIASHDDMLFNIADDIIDLDK